ncbi:2-oxoisovalerate dehydrogenase [Pedobacter cryotolerans]|jgi:predicted RNase H-like HicB family nuclease|uniref:2-oxoisovalerate dehydrogenase n=1 Tax=Pedobacter cryotolerans TaxID=2571270 RepID=A0A4U1C3R6_9SPHI|nr:2-oxoisovalerate dehydrogenase [Pedobacter cryotolerans]TKB99937.1 2-oxoisovalerate dehydrogenase [Pedobacter cryotolerans]
MNEVFFLVEEAVEGGYVAKALGESIFTEADTIDELKANIKEAVQCHFDEDKMPKIIRLHLVKEELLTL